MITCTLCGIKVYFRFIKDTLGLVQVVSSVVQVTINHTSGNIKCSSNSIKNTSGCVNCE